MSVPFVLECGGCRARVSIRKESLLGRRIRCPKCGDPILVEAPDDSVLEAEVVIDTEPVGHEVEEAVGDEFDPYGDGLNLDDDAFNDAGFDDLELSTPLRPRPTNRKKRSGRDREKQHSSQKRATPARAAAVPRWVLAVAIGGSILGIVVVVAVLLLVFGGDDDEPVATVAESGPLPVSERETVDETGRRVSVVEVRPPETSVFDGADSVVPVPVDVDLTGLPQAARNVVLVRSEDGSGVANGVYFFQRNERSFVVCMVRPLVPNEQLRVDLYPGQPDQQTVPVRRWVVSGELMYLELEGTVAPPVEMDLEPGADRTAGNVRVFGFQPVSPDAPETLNWAEFAVEWPDGEGLQVPGEEMLAGALVCDQQGRGLAVLGEFNWSRQRQNPPRMGTPFSYVAEQIRPSGVGWLELKKPSGQFAMADGTQQRPVYGVNASYTDLLHQVEAIQLWVGSFSRLKTDISFDRDRFENPVTSDMRPVALQRLRVEQPVLLRGLVVLPDGVGSDLVGIVTQVHFLFEDGSQFYGRPHVMRQDVPQFQRARPELTDALYSSLADTRVVDAEDVDFSHRFVPSPVESNRQVGGPELEYGNARRVLYTLGTTGLDRVHEYPIEILPDYIWSADGQYVFFLSSYGRLHKIRVTDRTEVMTINLFAYCVDLEISAAGLLVLGHQQLWVLDEETLDVTSTMDIPGDAVSVASGSGARHAVVSSMNELTYVNLDEGSVTALPVSGADDQTIPVGSFTGIGMPDAGGELFVTDEQRLHHFRLTSEPTLQWQESTPPRTTRHMVLPQGDRRVVVRLLKPVDQAGFPRGTMIVYSQADLEVPIAGLPVSDAGGNTVLDPTSGGALINRTGVNTHWRREDGFPVQYLSRRIDIEYGSASPVETRAVVFGERQIHEYTFGEAVASPGSLRASGDEQAPVEMDQPLKSDTQQAGDWTVSRLDMTLNQDLAPTSLQQMSVGLNTVDSFVWTPDACVMMTDDGVLHRYRVPEWVEERQLSLFCTDLTLTTAGLITRSRLRNELVVLDAETLVIRDRLPIAKLHDIAASPADSRAWFIGISADHPDTALTSIDLATRERGRDHTIGDVNTMVRSLPTEDEIEELRSLWEISVSPDGEYLILSDSQRSDGNVVRFRIDGDTLVLQQDNGRSDSEVRAASTGVGSRLEALTLVELRRKAGDDLMLYERVEVPGAQATDMRIYIHPQEPGVLLMADRRIWWAESDER